jgi:hypothetical protein
LIILAFASFPWHSMKLYLCSFWIIKIASLWISYLRAYIIILNAHKKNILVNLLAFSIWSSLFLLPTFVHLSLTWKMAEPCDIFLRNNHGKWLMVVNLEKSFSIKNCSMGKKILKILYTCLKKKVRPCLVSIGLVLSEEKIFEKVYDVRRRWTPSDGIFDLLGQVS